LKVRASLLLVLFVHVLLHPWVHTIGTAKAPGSTTSVTRSVPSNAGVTSGDQCELCRVGHSATAVPQLPETDLLNPRWIRTSLQAVNYASLQVDRRLPSRAPPIL
jgi:hypothetical protein